MYHTVFDVTSVGYKNWFVPACGIVFIFVAVFMLNRKRVESEHELPSGKNTWLRYSLLGFGVLWVLVAFIVTFGDYWRGVNAMRAQQASVVEGAVTEFHPKLRSSNKSESFRVKDVRFRYRDNLVAAGFNTTQAHGGPIREGMSVKIWYLHGEILRLDIKEPQ